MTADGAAHRSFEAGSFEAGSFEAALPALGRATNLLRRHEPLPGGILVAARRAGLVGMLPFGLADVQRSTLVTDRHLFQIGSISKFLASVSVGRLADRGLLRLDDPVVGHLPWLDMGPHTDRITVGHLLAHTAGLVSGADALTDELAQAWSLRHRSSFEPGTRFYYSNVGYVVAGLLISHLAGRHHGEFLEDEVFAPLGAGGAVGSIRNADRARMAVGYAPAADDRPWLPGDPVAAAPWLEAFGADGNVAMDAPALAALLRLLLGDGSVAGTRILSADGMRRITTPTAPAGEPIAAGGLGMAVTTSRYGLGINIETIGGARCLTHGGGMVGYASFVLADPERDIAVGVMTNANGDCLAAQALARYAHRLLVSGAGRDPAEIDPAEIDPAEFDPGKRAAACPLADLEDLAGTDSRGVQVPVTIERDAATGALRCLAGGDSGVVLRDAYGRFCTDHPALRSQYLHRRTAAASTGSACPVAGDTPLLVGHYRAHNPWFANFRIRRRGAALLLTATGGVEAPSDDEELVPLGDGSFRVGAEPWRPERLRCVAEVDGVAVLLDLGGCSYSRTPAG